MESFAALSGICTNKLSQTARLVLEVECFFGVFKCTSGNNMVMPRVHWQARGDIWITLLKFDQEIMMPLNGSTYCFSTFCTPMGFHQMDKICT